MIASPPCQVPPVFAVFPVVTNGLTPSLAIPPTPHMAPPQLPPPPAAHAVTVAGSSIGTPTNQPCQRQRSLILPYPTYRMLPTILSAGRCCWIAAVKSIPLYEAVASTSTG